MKTHLVTEASYPSQRLKAHHLKALALSSHRFAKKIKDVRSKVLHARATRILPCMMTQKERLTFGIQTAGVMEDIMLAPGGRFLATLSSDSVNWPGSTLISIWDLGLSSAFIVKALVRSLEPADDLELRLFFPDLERPGIFYLVSVQRCLAS